MYTTSSTYQLLRLSLLDHVALWFICVTTVALAFCLTRVHSKVFAGFVRFVDQPVLVMLNHVTYRVLRCLSGTQLVSLILQSKELFITRESTSNMTATYTQSSIHLLSKERFYPDEQSQHVIVCMLMLSIQLRQQVSVTRYDLPCLG